jgi:hypothetical protein
MPAPSTVIVPLADALKQMLEGLDFAPAVKAYRWAPSMVATVPAAVIDIPEVRRTGIDEPEEQLGSDDWTLTFPVELLVDLAVADRDQTRVVELLEAFIAAVDANPSLGFPIVEDSKVVAGTPGYDLSEEARPLLTYDCEVQVLVRVPTAP